MISRVISTLNGVTPIKPLLITDLLSALGRQVQECLSARASHLVQRDQSHGIL